MSGQRLDKNTIFSSKRSLDFPISGRILPRRPLLVSLLQVVTQLSSLLCGSIFSVVLGRHRNSSIVTLTSLWSVVLWLSLQPAGWPFHLRTLEELTMLIRPGQLSLEETTLQPLKLSAESHSRRDQPISWRAVSQLPWISSSSGRLTWISTFSWRISSSSSGFTTMSAMTGVNSCSRPVHLCWPASFPTQLITPERWLISGQKNVEVSAPGTTATDNASSGWSQIWNFTTIITSEVWAAGWKDMVFSTTSPCGWPTV